MCSGNDIYYSSAPDTPIRGSIVLTTKRILTMHAILLAADLLDHLFSLRQVLLSTDNDLSQVLNFVTSVFAFWENSYAACSLVERMHEQSRWLALAAPLLLDLVGRCRHSNKEGWSLLKQRLPNWTCSLLKAVAATISCLPMTSRASPTQDKYLPMQRWLQQHPQHLAAVQAAVSSPGVSWFLWSFAAAFTGKVAGAAAYQALADGSPIVPDHVALLEYNPTEFAMADPDGMISMLLSCLCHLHLHLPAEQVLKDLLEIRKQQQEGQHSGSTSSSSRGSRVVDAGGAECTSSRGNADGGGHGGSSRDAGSEAAAAEAAGDHASAGCSCCGATKSPIPHDVPWLFTVLPGRADASVPQASSSTNHAVAPVASGARGAGNAAAARLTPATAARLRPAAAAARGAPAAAAAAEGGEAATASGTRGARDAAVPAAVAEGRCATTSSAADPCLHCPPPISLNHLKLFLELMLCIWPEHADKERYCCWDLLLLLVGLLQQASVGVRRQLMQQRGVLVWQLLYHVLLDDGKFGSGGVTQSQFACVVANAWQASFVLGRLASSNAGDVGEFKVEDVDWEEELKLQDPVVHQLVLLVLQSLLYEPLPMELVKGGGTELKGMYITVSGRTLQGLGG